MTEFQEYVEHGWFLVPIPPGQKGPRTRGWQRKENCIRTPERAAKLRNAGLAHAYSGTCAIDVDDYPVAAAWLAERGVDLDALFADPESVQISSGRTNHGKLIYSLPEPLASKTVAKNKDKKAALDFRCATATGMSTQDVLPPSIHPDTGVAYKWVYDEMITDWRTPPLIPEALHKIWLDELVATNTPESMPEKGAAIDELRELLKHQDPSANRDEWLAIGMAIHHETDGAQEGLELWDTWSQGSNKYVSYKDHETCWRSFHDTPNAVTVGMLRQGAVATADEFENVTNVDLDEDDPWAAVEQKNRERFKLTHVSEVAKRPPPEWIVDGIIPQADLAMLYGASGAGKSFVALDLAFSVANGFVWFNRKSKKGTVAWIAAEAVGAMRNRAKAYAQARGVTLENSDLWIVEQTLSLMDEQDANALTHVMQTISPSLIIVDTLAAASGGANENSGEDMNVVLTNCRKLHEATGALILIIHHTGKDASRGARGWSGIKAAMHTELMVHHADDSSLRIMQSTKQRDTLDGEKFPFTLQVVPLGFDDDMTSCVVDPLDQSVLTSDSGRKLGATQKMLFDAACALSKSVDGNESIRLQDVYDAAITQMPEPVTGKRDSRQQAVQRATASLHELGYVTISDGQLMIGSSIDD